MQVSRRQFVAAAIGSLLLPSIKLDLSHERDLSTLVNEFCEVKGCLRRYNLQQPWECNGDSVASDGRALIRIPGLRYVPEGGEARVPNAEKVFDQFWRESGWMNLPRERLRKDECGGCPFCVRTDCEKCDGVGDLWIDEFNHTGPCPRCRGLGYVPQADCEFCHGTRYQEMLPNLDQWGDQLICVRFARLVRRIPGARWLPGSNVDPVRPILIRGDGGIRAMVMPVVIPAS